MMNNFWYFLVIFSMFVPRISSIIGLVSAIGFTMTGILFPIIFDLFTFPIGEGFWEKFRQIKNYFIIAICILILVFGTYTSILELVRDNLNFRGSQSEQKRLGSTDKLNIEIIFIDLDVITNIWFCSWSLIGIKPHAPARRTIRLHVLEVTLKIIYMKFSTYETTFDALLNPGLLLIRIPAGSTIWIPSEVIWLFKYTPLLTKDVVFILSW